MPEAVTIIPARGGSKGLPGKNLRQVGGLSLVARAVRSALAASSTGRVIVSTDDDSIGSAGSGAGAEVLHRPAELATDDASSESVLINVLDEITTETGSTPPVTVMIQCTSPFIQPGDIDATVRALRYADCALTVARSHRFLWRQTDDGAAAMNHDWRLRPRRQATELEYVETGAVYAMRSAGLLANKHRFFGRIALCEVPAERSVEIDDALDLEVAVALSRRLDVGLGLLRLPTGALVLDFDGVLTDDRVTTSQDGTESVVSSRSDGLGLERLRRSGLRILVLSRERNPVVQMRCDKLQLELIQGVDDKAAALKEWLSEHGVDPADVIYVGNDVNDIECLRLVGAPVAVADAHTGVIPHARHVLSRPGGKGAIRELSDLLAEQLGNES